MNEFIQFKKQRDLGEMLTDTFKFIRLNWKPLYGLIFRIAGPALLLVLFAFIYYMQSTLGSFDFLSAQTDLGMFSANFFISFLLLMASGVAFYALLYGTVLHYIKSYVNNEGVVSEAEVKAGVKKDFWGLIGLGFLTGLIIAFGLILCLLPGVYLGVVFASAYAVLVIEKRSVSDTISYCFDLIKGEFWMTFATLLVVFILYYIIIFIFQMPQYIYFFIKSFTMNEQITSDPAALFDGIYIALNAVAMIAQYLAYTLIVICTVFVYYNLNEKRNFTGTIEAIDSLGKEE
ncbi:hypothetical protein [Ulvibacter antarcticus]|uniref:Glycerophosphoryl diester phosphodiesterase membrane domain-containing protein n=1 Tax=Ulvibacter antarcticus TaxID=442714 RepID=A0A3L9YY48_9FLAO|nr:hypothetical protein [Ulvibacter antarcticus]RMA64737.1 hypothetical protein BXY75_1618 [Ulvibacter antarcticus]